MKKSLIQVVYTSTCLNWIFWMIPWAQKLDFRFLIHHYIYDSLILHIKQAMLQATWAWNILCTNDLLAILKKKMLSLAWPVWFTLYLSWLFVSYIYLYCIIILYIYLWVPANADLVKIKGLNWLLALFKWPAWVPITYKCPYMLCSSLCSTPLTCIISLGIVTSGPLNTLGSFISFHVKRSKVEP